MPVVDEALHGIEEAGAGQQRNRDEEREQEVVLGILERRLAQREAAHFGMRQMAGSAAANPANEARNSGTSSLMPCTMSIATNGASANAPIFCARLPDLSHGREHLFDGLFGQNADCSSPAAS